SAVSILRGPGWAATTPFGQTAAVTVSGQTVSLREFGFTQIGVGPLGPETLANQTTAGMQTTPGGGNGWGSKQSVALDAQSNHVVVWEGNGPGDDDGIFARLYNAAGSPLTGEFRVNVTTSGPQRIPVVAMADDGSFVVSWFGPNGRDPQWVWMRQYNAA